MSLYNFVTAIVSGTPSTAPGRPRIHPHTRREKNVVSSEMFKRSFMKMGRTTFSTIALISQKPICPALVLP